MSERVYITRDGVFPVRAQRISRVQTGLPLARWMQYYPTDGKHSLERLIADDLLAQSPYRNARGFAVAAAYDLTLIFWDEAAGMYHWCDTVSRDGYAFYEDSTVLVGDPETLPKQNDYLFVGGELHGETR